MLDGISKKSLAVAYAVKRKAKKDALMHKDAHEEGAAQDSLASELAKKVVQEPQSVKERTEAGLKEMFKADKDMYFEGDEKPEAPPPSFAHGGVIDRILAKRMKHYSEGGVVANDTDMDFAKKEPAEFDYLVKQGGDEFHYTGKNSGDELSAPGEMSRREAMLRKILALKRR